MKHNIAIWFRVYRDGSIHCDTYGPSNVDDPDTFGPFNLEFPVPPAVLAESMDRKEAAQIEGKVKSARKVRAVAS